MQELIDRLDLTEKQLDKENNLIMSCALFAAKNMAIEALEKEKEQIMNAYCDGAKGGANGTKGQHEFGWVSRHTRNKYYNQTYNQNK